ncbi:hypothetical protein BDF14DRAFT_1795659 [Spinellus fusiger]|nr:hypothetical protein BDF14DRAFT_1795659 [Spinellus fusiger]
MTEIQSRPLDDRGKQVMLDVLHRFEAENNALDSHSEEEEENDLAQRLGNVDLNTLDNDTLWEKLSLQERTAFEAMLLQLEHPDQQQDLLDSLGLSPNAYSPWWEAYTPPVSLVQLLGEAEAPSTPSTPSTALPSLADLPRYSDLMPGKDLHPRLVWTTLHIGMTYCYLMRQCLGEPEEDQPNTLHVLEQLSASVLFSKDQPVYTSAAHVAAEIAERVVGLETPSSSSSAACSTSRYSLLVSLCLSDALALLGKPQGLARAISEVWRLLETACAVSCSGREKKRIRLASHKAHFHRAVAGALGKDGEAVLQQSLVMEQQRIEMEQRSFERHQKVAMEALHKLQPKITELS